MKKHILSAVLLLSSLLSAQMALTASANEEIGDVLLISPRPNTVPTETKTVKNEMDTALRYQYAQTAGMYAYDGIASRLYELGVLLGDGVNFHLDQLPDRQQACVMVVRMRGEEEAALAAYEAGEITCPFTDVTDEWVKPYLAWLYEKKITLGVGEGKFGNSVCTAQDYVTFMLRALGYTVAWDPNSGWPDVFYADVLDFARGLDLWDERLDCEPSFHRGVMSAVTYQTLAADVKGTEDRLLSHLAQTGAVDAERAQPILDLYDKVDAAAALETAAFSLNSNGIRMTGHMVQDEYHVRSVINAAAGNTEETAYGGMTLNVGLDFSDGRQAASLHGEMHVTDGDTDVTVPMGMWLRDGVVYVELMDQQMQVDAADTDSLMTLIPSFGDLSLLFENAGYPYYAVSDVFIETLDGTAVIYDTTDFMWPIVAVQTDSEGFSENAVMTALVSIRKVLGEDGVPVSVSNRMYAQITEADTATGTADSAETLSETTVTYTAWGDSAVMTFPDLT